MLHFKETRYGFEWGSAKISRCCSDKKKGWIVLEIETPKYPEGKKIQVYITKTGKVRIMDIEGEWEKPKKRNKK